MRGDNNKGTLRHNDSERSIHPSSSSHPRPPLVAAAVVLHPALSGNNKVRVRGTRARVPNGRARTACRACESARQRACAGAATLMFAITSWKVL